MPLKLEDTMYTCHVYVNNKSYMYGSVFTSFHLVSKPVKRLSMGMGSSGLLAYWTNNYKGNLQ